MKKVDIKRRKWLNPAGHCDTGAISYSVKNDGWRGVDAEISIWDCGKKITLAFDYRNEKSAKQRAEKLRILIDSLQEVERAMAEGYEYAEKEEQESDWDDSEYGC